MKNCKGFSIPALVIIIAVVVVAGVAVAILLGNGGFGFGGGNGNESGSNEEPNSQVETIETPPVIEELKYVEITVSGNEYIYKNTKYSLDDLISDLTSLEEEAKVKITDDNSSRKAYKKIIDALIENKIPYIEVK